VAPLRAFTSAALCTRVAILVGSLLGPPALASTLFEQGQALFMGRSPLAGKIRGHRRELPPEVVVCRNCHAAREQLPPPTSSAPRIDGALLLELRERRGGPPSAYSEQSFCKLLRTGVDPAHVLISREMPIYVTDAAQCSSLWRFLTDPKGS
jgi:hypothetical protein